MNFKIRIEGTDAAFDCAAGETVLDAAARGGLELPYSCRKGVCGNCRGRVTAGTLAPGTAGGSPETGIEAADEHLFCRARPASDLTIAPRSWQRIDPTARKTVQAKVFRITPAAPDVSIVQLRFAAGVRVKFRAGQYLQVLLPDGECRSYSMANAPHESDGAQLHVRHVAGGAFSDTLLPTLKPGDLLQVELPHGDFWLREDSGRPLLMVAGGTGFAPIRSMVEYLLRKQAGAPLPVPLHLYWGVRAPTTHYAAEQIERWRGQLPQLQYHAVTSTRPRGSEGAGHRGSLVEAVLAGGLDLTGYDVYACGAPAMIAALRSACCHELGLPPDRFFSDAFVAGAG